MTADARIAGESAFWSLFVPNASDLPLLGGLEDAERRGIGVLEEDVGARSASASDAAFAPATSSNEPVKTDVAVPAGFAALKPPSNARNVDLMDGSSTPPTMPALPVFVSPPGEEAAEVRGLFELEDDRREVRRGARARRRHEDRLRVLLRDARGRVLELEAVPEDEARPLRRVGAELLLELGRRLDLHVRDPGAELLLDRLEPLLGAGVPARVRDRARRQEGDREGRGGRLRGRLRRARAAGRESQEGGEGGDGRRERVVSRVLLAGSL